MNILLRCQRFWTDVILALILGVIANLTGCAATQMGPNQVPPGKHLQSIAIAPQTAAVALGNNLQFSATALFSDGSKTDVTGTAAWISTQPKVASMKPAGMAISKTTGTTSISAVYELVSAASTLTVAAPALTSIAVTPQTPSLTINQSVQLSAIGTLTDGTTQDLSNVVK